MSGNSFDWKTYASTITIPKADLLPYFGPVMRGGKTFYRNYHRPIKGGLTLVDLIRKANEKERAEHVQFMWREVFGDGS